MRVLLVSREDTVFALRLYLWIRHLLLTGEPPVALGLSTPTLGSRVYCQLPLYLYMSSRKPSRGNPVQVAVVGGGICGLTCAIMLMKAGVPVQVYEAAVMRLLSRSPQLSPTH